MMLKVYLYRAGEQMQEETIKGQRSRDTDSLRASFGHEGCPVCTVVLEYLDRSIDNWEYEGFSDVQHRHELIHSRVQQLRSEEMRLLLSQSTGLSLVHLAQARQQVEVDDPTVLRHLLACQLTCTRRALEEVRELVRKHDYRFRDEPRGHEMTSWRRGAELCAGNPCVR